MTLSTEGLRVALADPNVGAFLRVIRERESGQGADAYTIINGGQHFADFSRHPFDRLPTTKGGKASGAYQFLPTTWGRLCDQYEFADFGPETQDLGAVALIAGRGALQDVVAGRFEQACIKCRKEWTSLPGAAEASAAWTMDKARAVFVNYGGRVSNDELLDRPEPAPIEERDMSNIPPNIDTSSERVQGASMPIFAALLPTILSFIPELVKIFGSGATSEVAKRNVAAVSVITDALVKSTATPNLQAAVEAMAADPAVAKAARAAVVAEPAVMVLLEVGGGIADARKFDLAQQSSDSPFYKTSAVFWISLLLLPMVFWYVGSSIVGGIAIPPEMPWAFKFVLMMFGTAWDAGAKVGLANLVVGMILGGIVGVYYGVSVTQNKQQSPAKEQA